MADVVGDAAALVDHLGVGRFAVKGGSGGAPHALACAALLPARVAGCAAVSSGAPLTEVEIQGLVAINRESFRALRSGRDELVRRLSVLRSELLEDSEKAFEVNHSDAALTDRARTPAQYERYAETNSEALRAGVQGWVDDMLCINDKPWGFQLASIKCPVSFWHSTDDRNVPLSAVQRLHQGLTTSTLHVWDNAGHSGGDQNEVLRELLSIVA